MESVLTRSAMAAPAPTNSTSADADCSGEHCKISMPAAFESCNSKCQVFVDYTNCVLQTVSVEEAGKNGNVTSIKNDGATACTATMCPKHEEFSACFPCMIDIVKEEGNSSNTNSFIQEWNEIAENLTSNCATAGVKNVTFPLLPLDNSTSPDNSTTAGNSSAAGNSSDNGNSSINSNSTDNSTTTKKPDSAASSTSATFGSIVVAVGVAVAALL